MLRIYADRNGRLSSIDILQEPEATTAIWVDLHSPTPEEVKLVEARLGITIPTRDEMAEIELSDRLYDEDGAEFMTMTALAGIEGDEPVKAPLTFIVKGQTPYAIATPDRSPPL